MKDSERVSFHFSSGFLFLNPLGPTHSTIKTSIVIIHSKYFPDSDWLKAHA